MRLSAVVRGRVQMVGFRDFASRHARAHELRGYVRNRPDGALEVVAEGDRAGLEALLGVLRQGPPGAVVDSVESTWEDGEGSFQRWELRW